jgi:hypothetical protein
VHELCVFRNNLYVCLDFCGESYVYQKFSEEPLRLLKLKINLI